MLNARVALTISAQGGRYLEANNHAWAQSVLQEADLLRRARSNDYNWFPVKVMRYSLRRKEKRIVAALRVCKGKQGNVAKLLAGLSADGIADFIARHGRSFRESSS